MQNKLFFRDFNIFFANSYLFFFNNNKLGRIVSIISDWHNDDYYTCAVKAEILSKASDLTFIDITHSVESFNHIQAAFILKSVYKKFPSGTIHLFAVNSVPEEGESYVVAKYYDQFFIAANNGSLGLIFDKNPEEVREIKTSTSILSETFPELNIFSKIVFDIHQAGNLTNIGEKATDVVRRPSLLPQIDTNEINAKIIYIDSYKNGITNITKDLFDEHISNKNFEISIENSLTKIKRISSNYKDVESGTILCLFNSLNLLEIAVREGKAAQLLNLSTRTQIRIKF